MREGDGDIYYTISFSEYRTLNVPSVQITTKVRNNGLCRDLHLQLQVDLIQWLEEIHSGGYQNRNTEMEVHILKFIMQTMEQLRQVLKAWKVQF